MQSEYLNTKAGERWHCSFVLRVRGREKTLPNTQLTNYMDRETTFPSMNHPKDQRPAIGKFLTSTRHRFQRY